MFCTYVLQIVVLKHKIVLQYDDWATGRKKPARRRRIFSILTKNWIFRSLKLKIFKNLKGGWSETRRVGEGMHTP
jgi:hypothetical protein